jgi:hypothetical protein
MVAETALRSLSFGFAGLFLLAAAHKLLTLAAGTEDEQPLLARRGVRGAGARAALSITAAVEVAVAALLAVKPAVGFLAAAGLLAFYTRELRLLAPDEGCRCFGGLLDVETPRGSIRRNLALVAIAVVGAVSYLSEAVGIASASQLTVGIATLTLAVPAAMFLLNRQARAPDRPFVDTA